VTLSRSSVRVALLAFLPLLCLVLVAGGARAQCPEPSALDQRPAAEPLRVSKVPGAGGTLAVSWEDVGAADYILYEGSIASLASGIYDHVDFPAPAAGPLLDVPMPATDSYFIAASACATGDSSHGRDSDGRERPRPPAPATWALTIAVANAPRVFGVQIDVGHGAPYTVGPGFGIGPFSTGAAGSPTSLSSTAPDTLRVVAVFFEFDPDPSFDAPSAPAPGVEVVEVIARGPDVAPTAADFPILACGAHDWFGSSIPGATCSLTRIERR
jgi:hypothetical protein